MGELLRRFCALVRSARDASRGQVNPPRADRREHAHLDFVLSEEDVGRLDALDRSGQTAKARAQAVVVNEEAGQQALPIPLPIPLRRRGSSAYRSETDETRE